VEAITPSWICSNSGTGTVIRVDLMMSIPEVSVVLVVKCVVFRETKALAGMIIVLAESLMKTIKLNKVLDHQNCFDSVQYSSLLW